MTDTSLPEDNEALRAMVIALQAQNEVLHRQEEVLQQKSRTLQTQMRIPVKMNTDSG